MEIAIIGLIIPGFFASGTKGLVSDNGDGTFNYDPNGQFEDLAVGERATDSFTYTISDGYGGIDTATVTIRVIGLQDESVIYLPLLER
jgi:VCBS repeat-containing protein